MEAAAKYEFQQMDGGVKVRASYADWRCSVLEQPLPRFQVGALRSCVSVHWLGNFSARNRLLLDQSTASKVETLPAYAGLMQRVVINDLLTQITAVFVTIGGGGASNGSGTRTTTTGNYRVADLRHGPGDAGGARTPGATRLGL